MLSNLVYEYYMNNKAKIPDGWAMPDDLAKKVSKALNRKPITPKDELQDALNEMARDISLIEPNPQDWGDWVIYLLAQLEAEALRRRNNDAYNEMLNSLEKEFN